jgi:CBS domain-containing protein
MTSVRRCPAVFRFAFHTTFIPVCPHGGAVKQKGKRMSDFNPLPVFTLDESISLFRNIDDPVSKVKLDSPAILVMTDLRRIRAVTVSPKLAIGAALEKMKTTGVRLLFVTEDEVTVMGLITSTDIQGELPLRIQLDRSLRHEEIAVGDIMMPSAQFELLSLRDVLAAKVGDIVASLQQAARRHALVFEREPQSGQNAIRGLFSASQIGQQIGQPIESLPVARTFADVEVALNDGF